MRGPVLTAILAALSLLSPAAARAQTATGILYGTPLWVYPVLALLLALGWQARRPRTLSLYRLLITPLVFIAWGLLSLATRHGPLPLLALDWVLAGLGGGALALSTVQLAGLQVDRRRAVVHLPGSLLPLIRNLLIFGAKYALAVAAALHPAMRGHLVVYDIAISGAAAGYFLGWLWRLALTYRQAPDLSGSAFSPAGNEQ